jgi:hypothetical protein
MTTNRRRLNRADAEHLLRRDRVERLRDGDPLLERLRTAAAPAFADEFVGEREAVAAFRLTAHEPEPLPRRRSMIKTALTKVLTLKAAAVLAAASAGGVALAASTGVLPNPLDHSSPNTPASAHATASHGPGGAHGTPSPSLVGLCRAYAAGAGADHGKALDDPAFTVLISTAGGRDNVDAYCASVLTSPGASAEPTHGAATPHLTGAPTAHPSGAPTEHPTGSPTAHPTGSP